MPDPVNYVATCAGHAFFGIAEDPANRVAVMQAGCPLRIQLAGGWVLPPQDRAAARDEVRVALRNQLAHGDWYKVTEPKAVALLARIAAEYAGIPWAPEAGIRGMANYPTRPVLTPHGWFPSVSAAGLALGLSRQAVWNRATRRSPGWEFEDTPED